MAPIAQEQPNMRRPCCALEAFGERVKHSPHVVNFVTGPPGSGKTRAVVHAGEGHQHVDKVEPAARRLTTYHLFTKCASSLQSALGFSAEVAKFSSLMSARRAASSSSTSTDKVEFLGYNMIFVFEQATDFFLAKEGVADLAEEAEEDREERLLILGIVRSSIERLLEAAIMLMSSTTSSRSTSSTSSSTMTLTSSSSSRTRNRTARIFFVVDESGKVAEDRVIGYFTPSSCGGKIAVFDAPAPLDYASRYWLALQLLGSGTERGASETSPASSDKETAGRGRGVRVRGGRGRGGDAASSTSTVVDNVEVLARQTSSLARYLAAETVGFSAADVVGLYRLAVLRSLEGGIGVNNMLGTGAGGAPSVPSLTKAAIAHTRRTQEPAGARMDGAFLPRAQVARLVDDVGDISFNTGEGHDPASASSPTEDEDLLRPPCTGKFPDDDRFHFRTVLDRVVVGLEKVKQGLEQRFYGVENPPAPAASEAVGRGGEKENIKTSGAQHLHLQPPYDQVYQVFQQHQQPRPLLFAGPSGSGKTTLALALARALRWNAFSASAAEIVGARVGSSERRLSQLLQAARRCAPSVVVLEDFDSIVGVGPAAASTGSYGTTERLATVLRQTLDGFVAADHVAGGGRLTRDVEEQEAEEKGGTTSETTSCAPPVVLVIGILSAAASASVSSHQQTSIFSSSSSTPPPGLERVWTALGLVSSTMTSSMLTQSTSKTSQEDQDLFCLRHLSREEAAELLRRRLRKCGPENRCLSEDEAFVDSVLEGLLVKSEGISPVQAAGDERTGSARRASSGSSPSRAGKKERRRSLSVQKRRELEYVFPAPTVTHAVVEAGARAVERTIQAQQIARKQREAAREARQSTARASLLGSLFPAFFNNSQGEEEDEPKDVSVLLTLEDFCVVQKAAPEDSAEVVN